MGGLEMGASILDARTCSDARLQSCFEFEIMMDGAFIAKVHAGLH
jgi:hypothetical protein